MSTGGIGAPPRGLPADLRIYLNRLKAHLATAGASADITALDTRLTAQIAALTRQISALSASSGSPSDGAVTYQGPWDASSGTAPSASPSKGDYYEVSIEGKTSIGGITTWNVGDWAVFNGTVWTRVDNSSFDLLAALVSEPTGFPNQDDSTISFVEATRTFTIAPALTSYDIYASGVKTTKTSAETIVIPDVTGEAFIYFDASTGALSQISSFDISLISHHVWVAAIYWNASIQRAVLIADERHGLVMDHDTHLHFHTSLGTTYASGLGLYNILADQSGDLDTHAQLAVQDGEIQDEDIRHSIVNGSPQTLDPILSAPLLWRTGANEWQIDDPDTFPLMYAGRASWAGTLPAYNVESAGTWSLSEVANGDYVLMHIVATNDIRWPIAVIVGGTYSSKTNAREAATTEITSMTGLPFTEVKPVGTLIFECRNSYANTVKARIDTTQEGSDYVDFRRSLLLGATSASGSADAAAAIAAHEAEEDPHPQYQQGLSLNFSYGDATPAVIGLPTGPLVTVSILITTGFDGTSPALTIGTIGSPDLLMAADQNDPTTVGRYESNPSMTVGENIYLTITPGTGASQGAGTVFVETA